MMPGIGERPVASEEILARFILRDGCVRADGTLRPDPFMPFKHVELSVTRHLGLEASELWAAGSLVAEETGTTLHGRADVTAEVFEKRNLHVTPKPLPNNPNHADVVDWPADKPSQKEIALLIDRDAVFQANPLPPPPPPPPRAE